MNIGYKVGELIYDANIYDGLNTFLSDLQFYKKWLPKNKEAEILELCCGTGRLTIPIAKDGYSICGVDYTPSMLEQAKMKAIEAELVIDFIVADIRMLDLQEKFDLIFNPNIQYIVESEKVQAVIAEYTTDDGRDVLIKQTMRYESTTQINRIEWHYFINGEFHSIQNLDMRMFFPQELDSYLERAGFDIIHKFGSFEEEAFNDNSEKQIYVLTLNDNKVLYEKIQNQR